MDNLSTSPSVSHYVAEKVYDAACREAKHKFGQAVVAAWEQCRRARGIMGLTDEEFRLMYRELIGPAEVEYLGDLQEAGTKRSQVLTDAVHHR